MCIKAPTPVTNSAIVIDSGSARNPRPIDNSPDGIHSNKVISYTRSSGGFDASPKKTAVAAKNEPLTVAVASQPA